MSHKNVKLCLKNILHSCEMIPHFIGDKGFPQYTSDRLIRSAIERKFTIIGQALKYATRKMPGLFDEISHTEEIIALSDILIHEYTKDMNQAVWDMVHNDLPLLDREVRAALSNMTA